MKKIIRIILAFLVIWKMTFIFAGLHLGKVLKNCSNASFDKNGGDYTLKFDEMSVDKKKQIVCELRDCFKQNSNIIARSRFFNNKPFQLKVNDKEIDQEVENQCN